MNLPCTVKIGNIPITFFCPSSGWRSFLKANYKPFISKTTARRAIKVFIQPVFEPDHSRKKLVADNKSGNWHIKRYDFESSSSSNFKKTILAVEKNKYAFDSWLRVFFTHCGITRGAFLLHGAGYSLGNKTFVFPGRSGKGKSTIIRIIGKSGALTDELVCVFKKGRSFFAASTPFWGELKKGTGKLYCGRLKKLFFLRHGKALKARGIPQRESLKELLKTVLFFSKNPEHVELLLNRLQGLACFAPCAKLFFRKDSSKKAILNTLR